MLLEPLGLAIVRLRLGGLGFLERVGKCLVGFFIFRPCLGQVRLCLFSFRPGLGQAGVGIVQLCGGLVDRAL
ncbi:MAG: hypothetical protein CMO43_04300 [Verrucomicrobiales bacterium]|nr:hypothetical protein [Verrucomicrobiales bacterium]